VAADVHGLQILNLDGIVPVIDDEIIPDTNFCLRNYPNPFNPQTTISLSLPASAKVKLDIYNSRGQKVVNMIDKQLSNGTHSVQWNGTDSNNKQVASGIYFAHIKYSGRNYTKKLLLLK